LKLSFFIEKIPVALFPMPDVNGYETVVKIELKNTLLIEKKSLFDLTIFMTFSSVHKKIF